MQLTVVLKQGPGQVPELQEAELRLMARRREHQRSVVPPRPRQLTGPGSRLHWVRRSKSGPFGYAGYALLVAIAKALEV